jgi:ABC-type nitrate/sulfonate/bicarbonate transport system ATPase subunit
VIDLADVAFTFGTAAAPVFEGLSLSLAPGEFVGVVGPSGCGKTTLLSLIARDMPPTRGTVQVQGQARRVFQHDGLFPWRTARENVALALRRSITAEEADRQIKEILALVGLEAFENHYPHQLSGGMRQRVEIARALSGDSDILLLDEPFSALDYLTRLRLRKELARLVAERPRTVALVTHDIEEAAQLADRIIVLTERPARVAFELTINVPRPRDPTQPEVVEIVRTVLAKMGV